MLKARQIDSYQGKLVFKVPVLVKLNSSYSCTTVREEVVTVIAHSPAEAANWVIGVLGRPETEVFAYGPQGGKTYRYIGWESAIGMLMQKSGWAGRSGCPAQLELFDMWDGAIQDMLMDPFGQKRRLS